MVPDGVLCDRGQIGVSKLFASGHHVASCVPLLSQASYHDHLYHGLDSLQTGPVYFDFLDYVS